MLPTTTSCLLLLLLLLLLLPPNPIALASFTTLDPAAFKPFLNDDDYQWAVQNVPFFEISEPDLTEAYFFRWTTYKKHITLTNGTWARRLGGSYIVTEFTPKVGWSGLYNSIPCAAGHHIYEGRWLRNSTFIDDYSRFWFLGGGEPRRYTFWAANAIYNRYLVKLESALPISLLPYLEENYHNWVKEHFVPQHKCFYQTDVSDGGENSVSGPGCRPSINSAMYAELMALARIWELKKGPTSAEVALYERDAKDLQNNILKLLWNEEYQAGSANRKREPMDCVLDWPSDTLVPTRELLALATPYYFLLVPQEPSEYNGKDYGKFARQWETLLDSTKGLGATWGPRTVERSDPHYNYSCKHECNWNGPSWPFETSRLLMGLANLLIDYPAQSSINKNDFFDLVSQYARIHTRSHPINATLPWISENIHPDLGYWIARSILYADHSPMKNRGKDYNHSSFADIILTGIIGLRPRADDTLVINPLISSEKPPKYFAVDNLLYHGREVSVLWDTDGSRYHKGIGMSLFLDGTLEAHSPTLGPISSTL